MDTATNTVSYKEPHLTRFALVRPATTWAPSPPSSVSASAIAIGGVRIAWTNPTSGFHHAWILRATSATGTRNLLATNIKTASYDDTTAKSGTTYYYDVAAVDRAGNVSSSVRASIIATAGDMPSGQTNIDPSGFADGSLVRAANTIEVYVTKKIGALVVIRHIVNPRIFDVYGHFGGTAAWSKVVGVDSLGSAKKSAWVRGSDGKVWEVNGDGTRHWMQMTWMQFASRVAAGDSVLATNLIFEVNAAELALYTTGTAVLP